jgi:hypothetical protein
MTAEEATMKRTLLALLLAAGTVGGIGTLVSAQTPPTPKTAPAQAPGQARGSGAAAGPAMMGGGQGQGMMGSPGMMGGGMMGGGMCPMVGGAGTKVEVKKIDKGVTMTFTSSDPATVTRIQKMAEAMRLMHEANTQ